MKPSEDTNTLWNLFTHPGIYVSALGSLIPVRIGLFCCYFFWCQPTRLACQPLQSGNMQYTIVDDNVEVAPIYRCKGKATKPTRPCKNHVLAIECLPKQSESHHKLQLKSFAVPTQGSLGKITQNPGDAGMHITSVTRLRLDTTHGTTDWNEQEEKNA